MISVYFIEIIPHDQEEFLFILQKLQLNITIPFCNPFVMNVVPPSQSGKIYWIHKLLEEAKKLRPLPLFVFYFYNGRFQDIYQKIKLFNDMQSLEGKNDFKLTFINCSAQFSNVHNVLAKYGTKKLIPCLFVFDNFMFLSDGKDNWNKLHHYVMKDCPYSNVSLIFLCQDLMYKAEKF